MNPNRPQPPPQPPQSWRSEELQPIDEREWVHLFSEILQQARRPPLQQPVQSASTILHEYITNNGIVPAWDEIPLPGGRSLRSFQHAFDNFSRQGANAYYPMNPPPLKRSLQVDSQTQHGRVIAPKPVAGPVGPTRPIGPTHSTPLSPMGGPHMPTEQRKKRGRPSKKEQEERRLMFAAARMEQTQHPGPMAYLQSPATYGHPQQPMPSSEISPTVPQSAPHSVPQSPVIPAPLQPGATMSTPRQASRAESSGTSNSSGKRKRGRPGKTPSAVNPQPFGSIGRSEDYNTPPHTASREERRESEPSLREPQGGSSSAPPETGGRSGQADTGESTQQGSWKNTILNE
ncbi:hypothetical protein BT63DRAFT_412455 [Microthyrium microscopicum]|uniref:AT hook domain-containing protein n=1 Tax=Microthyrium microscopicum TaxID=703497 RepID=A0A6A6UGV6_9PEZI|nr:hypothetical protein BT63DRAFT_412455 [Microthyrium microscopicum]